MSSSQQPIQQPIQQPLRKKHQYTINKSDVSSKSLQKITKVCGHFWIHAQVALRDFFIFCSRSPVADCTDRYMRLEGHLFKGNHLAEQWSTFSKNLKKNTGSADADSWIQLWLWVITPGPQNVRCKGCVYAYRCMCMCMSCVYVCMQIYLYYIHIYHLYKFYI